MRPIRFPAFVLFAVIACAQIAFAAEKSSQCTVTVRTKMKSGDLKKRVFHTNAASPNACAEGARLHNENYFPPKISAVQVEYEFAGSGVVTLPEAH